MSNVWAMETEDMQMRIKMLELRKEKSPDVFAKYAANQECLLNKHDLHFRLEKDDDIESEVYADNQEYLLNKSGRLEKDDEVESEVSAAWIECDLEPGAADEQHKGQ